MKKILIIEDDDALCWLLTKILSLKYDVSVMNNGMEAMGWLTEGNFPELIISDLNMPSLNGMELLENIRSSGFLREIPVIILSGDENPAHKRQCLDLGAYKYILKPFQPDFLLEEVVKALEEQENAVVLKTL